MKFNQCLSGENHWKSNVLKTEGFGDVWSTSGKLRRAKMYRARHIQSTECKPLWQEAQLQAYASIIKYSRS